MALFKSSTTDKEGESNAQIEYASSALICFVVLL